MVLKDTGNLIHRGGVRFMSLAACMMSSPGGATCRFLKEEHKIYLGYTSSKNARRILYSKHAK